MTPLALLPSPADPAVFRLGPVAIPFYGLGYAVALTLGIWLTARLARRRGLDPAFVGDGILVVVLCGLIGARLYHVIDQWRLYEHDLIHIVLPPYSGLALYGGVIGGIVGLLLVTRRAHQPFRRWADIAVPALFFGQAIARWGNYFNQELYGPPTDAPWGIAIACLNRVAAYPCTLYPAATTGFHPLFFYESALDLLGGVVALYLVVRLAHRLRDGDVLALWLIWYGAVRAALETLRLSYDFTFFGVPVAQLIGLGAVAVGALLLVISHRPASAQDAGSTLDPAAGPVLAAGLEAPAADAEPDAGAQA